MPCHEEAGAVARLSHAPSAEKPRPADDPAAPPLHASPALAALVATIGIPLDPGLPEGMPVRQEALVAIVCPTLLARADVAAQLARMGALAGRVLVAPAPFPSRFRLYDAGPFSPAELERAARAPSPLGALAGGRPNGEDLVYAHLCRKHGFAFAAIAERHRPCPDRPIEPAAAGRLRTMIFDLGGSRRMVLAPRLDELADLLSAMAVRPPPLAHRLAVTTPRRLERRLRASIAGETERRTTDAIAALMPRLSARACPGPLQRAMIVAAPLVFGCGLAAGANLVEAVAFLLSVVTFLGLATTRLSAWAAAGLSAEPPPPLAESALPSYSVMAAVYKEANMMAQLVAALDGLDYPRDRLEILLLVEAVDAATRAAAEAAVQGRPHIRVVTVPAGQPRTKPRALAYGLAFCRGDIVTVYDAEDRPDRGQLRRAAAALVAGPDHLACVQARLEIEHADTPLKRQFQLEYACLFSGILPWLSAAELTLPLGGTSNHFKRHALEVSGGWDPYNVTEDADLGARLSRFGFTAAVVDSATAEEAPERLDVWLRQRRRWIKGWLMTWLVHMRNPVHLVVDLGLANALIFQLHLAANVLAPLAHPLWLLMIGAYFAGLLPLPEERSFLDTLLITGAGVDLLTGYGGNILLALRILERTGRGGRRRDVALMPFYWLLSSAAAWLAVAEMLVKPHYWHKTPHVARSGDTPPTRPEAPPPTAG